MNNPQSDFPSVSVIIVNWNHGAFLPGCLAALVAQDYPDLAITLVDNASGDGSPDWAAQHYPDLGLLRLSANLGFSRAFNQAVKAGSSTFVLSLNPDVTVRPNFVAELARAAQNDEGIGLAAPKLLCANAPTCLDSTGLFIDRRRRTYDRGQGQHDHGQYDGLHVTAGPAGESPGQMDVFGACGGAALYRRAMLEDTALDGEYFDENFFAYYEDADLAWRAQLRGWRCVYAPGAVATHVRGGGDRLRSKNRAPGVPAGQPARGSGVCGPRLAVRNRYLMTLKNDTWRYFLADLPWIAAAELPRLAYAALANPQVLLGLIDLARAWPHAWRKRRRIRQGKRVDDAALRHWFTAHDGRAGRRCTG